MIDRTNIIQSTLAEFSNHFLADLRKKIKITFANEHGIDAGLLRFLPILFYLL